MQPLNSHQAKESNLLQRRDEFHQRIFDEHVTNYTGEIHDIMDIIVEVMENGYRDTLFKDPQIKQKELKNLFMSLTCLVMAGMSTSIFSNMYMYNVYMMDKCKIKQI